MKLSPNNNQQTEFALMTTAFLWHGTILCVPEDLHFEKPVMTEDHSSPFSIHSVRRRVYHDLKQHFWMEWKLVDYICLVEFAYNNSWHASIKCAPFEMLNGRSVVLLFVGIGSSRSEHVFFEKFTYTWSQAFWYKGKLVLVQVSSSSRYSYHSNQIREDLSYTEEPESISRPSDRVYEEQRSLLSIFFGWNHPRAGDPLGDPRSLTGLLISLSSMIYSEKNKSRRSHLAGVASIFLSISFPLLLDIWWNTRPMLILLQPFRHVRGRHLPQIREQVREEYRAGASGGNPPPATIHTWLERFNKQKPHSFEKAVAPVDAENWISHMEKIFDVMDCNDAFKTRLAVYKFEGDALAWWKAYKQAKGGDAWVLTLTWAAFKELFFLQFFPRAEQEPFLRPAGFLDGCWALRRAGEELCWVYKSILDHVMCIQFTDVAQVADAARNLEILRDRDDYDRHKSGDRYHPYSQQGSHKSHGQSDDRQKNDRQGSDRQGGGGNYRNNNNNNYSRDNNRNSGSGTTKGTEDQQSHDLPIGRSHLKRSVVVLMVLASICGQGSSSAGLQERTCASSSGLADQKPAASGRVFPLSGSGRQFFSSTPNVTIPLLPDFGGCYKFRVDDDGILWQGTKLCVPEDPTLREALMTEAHSSPFSIHPGSTKMYHDLKQHFWWSGMKRDVATFVSKCLTCQQVKIEHQRASGLLQPLEIPVWKWDEISMDFVTGLPRTQRKHDAIWVVVDRLTKSAHFLPIRKDYPVSKLAEMFQQEIVRLHGTPSAIVSDRDPRFTSRFWKGLQKAWGTRLKFSTAFHPETDGQSERTIQTLEDMLRSCALEWAGNWDDYICLVEFAYNNSWHASIKCAPFEMLYGRKCRAPICWDQVGERILEGPEMIEVTNEKVAVAREKLKEAQTRQKSYADRHRRALEFQPGEHVFLKVSPTRGVRRFGIKGKLSPRFIGPFEILDRVGEVSYRLALPPQLSHVHNVFHVSLLRGYKYHPLHVVSYPFDQIREDLSYSYGKGLSLFIVPSGQTHEEQDDPFCQNSLEGIIHER
ncbi:putative nucleotidyltransferase, ribonuclease H [Tanacetum coccineum]